MASRREYHGNIRAPEFPANAEWVNTKTPLTLAELRGKLVLLDFWTYGCINCMHVLPDLKRLEALFPRELVVIGVHSAKFANEGQTENLRRIVARYGITHPVVNDRDMLIWQQYAVRAWPTTVLISPAGRVLAAHSGEGVFDAFYTAIQKAIQQYAAEGILNRNAVVKLETTQAANEVLLFPGKSIYDAELQALIISDSGHNRVIVAGLDGDIHQIIGSGEAALVDGSFGEAAFQNPQGLASDGQHLYIADTGNHALREADLRSRQVRTLAGDGEMTYHIAPGLAANSRLNSPWDVALDGDTLYIAMAGLHQIYVYDVASHKIGLFAGSGREALLDGRALDAALAQPSGLAVSDNMLYVADSEASAIRAISLTKDNWVTTLVGEGLFDFGDIDGAAPEARLQHALGVAAAKDALYIADTYNHKIKRFDLRTHVVDTFAGSGRPGDRDGTDLQAAFYEPGGLALSPTVLYISDTNNHAIRAADLNSGQVTTIHLSNATTAPSDVQANLSAPPNAAGDMQNRSFTVKLRIELPEHHELTHTQPSELSWELLAQDTGNVLRTGKQQFNTLSTEMQITGPNLSEALNIYLMIFYCHQERGVCLFEERTIEYADVDAAMSAAGEIVANVRIE